MSKITYNAESLKIMTLFEKVTKTRLKDYFVDENNLMTFVVDSLYIGKAIGKKAANVKKLEQLFKKKVKILGFDKNLVKFVSNLIFPLKAQIENEDNIILVKTQDIKTKAFLIGRNKSNIKNNLMIIKKYFKEIKDLKVA